MSCNFYTYFLRLKNTLLFNHFYVLFFIVKNVMQLVHWLTIIFYYDKFLIAINVLQLLYMLWLVHRLEHPNDKTWHMTVSVRVSAERYESSVWRRSDVSGVERHVAAGHFRTPAELLTPGARPRHQIQRQTLQLCIRGAGRVHHGLPEDHHRETWAAQRDDTTCSQKQRRWISTVDHVVQLRNNIHQKLY